LLKEMYKTDNFLNGFIEGQKLNTSIYNDWSYFTVQLRYFYTVFNTGTSPRIKCQNGKTKNTTIVKQRRRSIE
jgi:hypothetical protein